MSVVRRSLTVVAVAAAALATLTPNASANGAAPAVGKPRVAPAAPAIARGLIVKTTTSTPSKSLLKSADSAIGSKADAIKTKSLTGKISTIAFDQTVTESAARHAAAQVAKRSDVEWAVPDTLRHATATAPVVPNDPHFSGQRDVWDSTVTSPKGGYSVKAPVLWQKTKGSPDVVVAVVDSGILKDHPDIKNQLVDGYDMIGADQSNSGGLNSFETAGDGDGRDADPSDPGDWTTTNECGAQQPAEASSWHGTFVAGMIAAQANNNLGISGIAPDVKVQPVRVLGHCGGYDSDVIAGITWASGGHVDGVPDNPTPAKVVNLSLGSLAANANERDDACTAYSAAAAAGAGHSVFIAAAGNDGGNADLDIPASCSGYLSVGSTSLRGFSSWYSNIGSSVDISAPGGDTLVEGSTDSVLSLDNASPTSPAANGYGYARYEGTSMSTAEVSAGAALLASSGLDTPASVTSALLKTVSPFRSRSTTYANKKLKIGGHYYYFDLNCSGHSWCGHGTLDLSKVQAPLTKPTISGHPAIGEPLTVSQGRWVATPATVTYAWYRDGELQPAITGSRYTPTRADVGGTFTVRVAPSLDHFAPLGATSSATTPVPDGPDVTLSVPAGVRITHGKSQVVHVVVQGRSDGTVQIRRGDGIVMATGKLQADGTADINVPGVAWVGRSYAIRAAYLGAGSTSQASSPGVQVVVNPAKSTVTTSLASSVRTSSHASLHVTVKVSGDPNPTGTVKVYDGSHRLITTSLWSNSRGRKTISLPHLRKGNHSIKVVYYGNTSITSSHSRYEHIKAK